MSSEFLKRAGAQSRQRQQQFTPHTAQKELGGVGSSATKKASSFLQGAAQQTRNRQEEIRAKLPTVTEMGRAKEDLVQDWDEIVKGLGESQTAMTAGAKELEVLDRSYKADPTPERALAYTTALTKYQQEEKKYNRYRDSYQAYTAPEAYQGRIDAWEAQLPAMEEQEKAAKKALGTEQNILSGVKRYGTVEQIARAQAKVDAAEKAYQDVAAQSKALREKIDREKVNKEYMGFETLRGAEDFGEKSAYQTTANGKPEKMNLWNGQYLETGFDDILYDIINGNETAKSHGLNTGVRQYEEVTPEQRELFNYIYATQGPEKAYEYMDLIAQRIFTGEEAAVLNFMQKFGTSSLSAALGSGVAKLTGTKAEEGDGSDWYSQLLKDTQQATEQHPMAGAVGRAGGTMGLLTSIAAGVGAIPGFTQLPAIAQAALSGAASMGGSTAIQGLGDVATGNLGLGEYGMGVLGAAAAGAAGGAAASGVGAAGSAFLRSRGLTENMLARTVVAGLAGAGGGAARAGVTQGTQYLRDPDGYTPDMGAVAEEALVGFAFSALGYLTRNYTASPTEAAQMDADKAKAKELFGGLSEAEAKAKYRQMAKDLHPDLHPGDAAVEAEMKAVNGAWDWYTKNMMGQKATKGAAAYKEAQEAAKAGDMEVYHQAKAEYDQKVAEIAAMAADNPATSETDAQAVEILKAVSESRIAGETQATAPPPAATPAETETPKAAEELPGLSLPELPPETGLGTDIEKTAPQKESGQKTLVQEMQEMIPQIRGVVAPVATVTGDELPKEGKMVDRVLGFIEKMGGKATRPGFGDVLFSRSRIKNGLVGHGAGRAKVETFAAVPDVIRDGLEIDTIENYEGRGYDTHTFMAPVTYRGKPTYLGVIVTKDKQDGRYYVHEVIDENGNIILGEKKAQQPPSDGRASLAGAFDTVAVPEPSTERIPQPGTEVKEPEGLSLPSLENDVAQTGPERIDGYGKGTEGTGAPVSDGDPGRVRGISAGGQTGGMAEGTGGKARPAEQGRAAVERQNRGKALRWEKVSAASLGIEGGTEEPSVTVIPEKDWDDGLRATAKRVQEETGITPSFVLGQIPVNTGSGITRVRGVYSPGNIIIQADHMRLTTDQIADHEIFHDKASQTPGLIRELEERIVERYSPEEFGRVVETYIQKLRGVIDIPENASPDEIDEAYLAVMEEIMADAYAGINAFAAHAERFRGDVRETVESRQAGPRSEIAEATDRRTGPPEKWSYGGKNANRADLQSLSRAREMEKAGADTETIRRETGWFQGMDGLWRFEIDDSGMMYRGGGDTTTLGDLLTHEALFENYPQLRNARVTFEAMKGGALGEYRPEDNSIAISEKLRGAPEDTLIHEIQHAIQKAEGFTPGASLEYWQKNRDEITGDIEGVQRNLDLYLRDIGLTDFVKESMDKVVAGERTMDQHWAEVQAFKDRSKYAKEIAENERQLSELRKKLDDMQTAYDLYKNTAGEIEARDAEKRRSMSPEQRRETPPDLGDEDTVFAEREAEEDLSDPKPKTKFSMDEPVEETKDLVALHNLTEDKLLKSLALGGFPMPSIAVTKADIPHTNFGDITLVMNKSTVDPKADRRNMVYSADAWTPTFPATEYEIDEDVEGRIREKYYELYRKFGRDNVDVLYPWGNYAEDQLNREGGEDAILEKFRDSTDMMKVYLLDKGAEVPEPIVKEIVERLDDGKIALYDYMISELGEDVVKSTKRPDDFFASPAFKKEWYAEHGEAVEAAYRSFLKKHGFTDEQIENTMDHRSVGDNFSLAVEARRYLVNGPETRKTSTDTQATQEAIRKAVDQEDYRAWLQDLFGGIQKGSGINTGVDPYTRSGDRKSFWQTHIPATLNNIVKVMASEGEDGDNRNVTGFYGIKSIRASTADRFKSIEDMHKAEGKLRHMSQEEADQITDELGTRLQGIMQKIYEASPHGQYDNEYMEYDTIGNILMEAARADKATPQSVRKVFSGTKFQVTPDTAKEVVDLFGDVAKMPVNIFEAKPERAVHFDEVLSAIVPSTASTELRNKLTEAGVPVMEYQAGNEEDRLEKVNSVDKARFSVDDDPDDNEREIARLQDRLKRIESREYQEGIIASGGINAMGDVEREIQETRDRLSALRGTETPKEKPEKTKKPIAGSRPIVAKQDMRKNLMALFSTPEGKRAELGAYIDSFGDRLLKQGYLSEDDKQEFFDRMYREGAMTVPAEEYARAGRALVAGGRIHVNDQIREDLGDDWNEIRKRAFGAGVYLTSDANDPGVDVWNMNLADSLPGMFDETDLDMAEVLKRIVQLAEEGKDEKVSLAEYTAQLAQEEHIPEDALLDAMEKQMDYHLRAFAEKADLEVRLRDRTGVKIAQQREVSARERQRETLRRARDREKRKEMAQRQREHRELRELQDKTMKQLQWLSKNRNRAPKDLKAAWDEVLGDIDLYAVGAANELRWSKKHNATWRDLADMYKAAKEEDPNFLPSKELERIVARLDMDKIADMDVSALQDLYKAAVGLRTEFYNRNNVINDEKGRLFAEVYENSRKEIQESGTGYTGKKLDQYLNMEQLTPMNVLERMGGWDPDGDFYSMAKQLEKGERDVRAYRVQAKRILENFLNEHRDWIKTADGQGDDAVWYELEVPELVELGMGDKPIFGDTIKVYMTPTQKVQLYLESKNYDNLRHMTGGRTFVDKDLYSQGKRQEALAQGRTIKLAPETVKKIVSDLTPEERELAGLLEEYYNQFAKDEINKVSNPLYGFDKAMTDYYVPIRTNKNFTKSEIGVFDVTAEGVGHMKSREYSKSPSYNIGALDMFKEHVDQTSRWVGMSIPTQNWQTLLNWRTKNSSMGDVITHKWGEEGKRYIEDLLTELQGGKIRERSGPEIMDTILSNYISSVFGFNPSIVFKQAMSFPLAGAYLGWENIPNIPAALKVDDNLINAYTSELAYRLMGYATPETAQLKNNPSKLSENRALKFLFGGGSITAMDGWTVKTIWSWAENKVRRDHPELEMGTQEQIDAGQSPFYQEVAKTFEEAVSRSQPMYDVMHRAQIMRRSGAGWRALTLFKTVPIQQYNMLRQTVAEAQRMKRERDAGRATEEEFRASRGKAGRAILGVILAALGIEGINFLNNMAKSKGKRYRNEDGDITFTSAGKQFLEGFVQDNAGMIAGGDLAAELMGSIVTGDKWYGIETPGVTQVTEVLEQIIEASGQIQTMIRDGFDIVKNGGNLGEYFRRHGADYLGELDKVAETVAAYFGGLPAANVKSYALGALRWISPAFATAYEDALETAEKTGLAGLTGKALETRVGDILNNRLGRDGDASADVLAGLYEEGYPQVIPANTPKNISVNSEERKLSPYQQQFYDGVWRDTVEGNLDELTGSATFRAATPETQARMVKKLYDLAADRAKAELYDDYEIKDSTETARAVQAAGGSAADWAAWAGAVMGIKQQEQYGILRRMDLGDGVKKAILGGLLGTNMETESGEPSQYAKMETILKEQTMDAYLELKSADAVDEYLKCTKKGMDPATARETALGMGEIRESAGKGASTLELYRAAVAASRNQEDQMAALQAIMGESEYDRLEAGVAAGITPEQYVTAKETIKATDDNGSVTQKEAETAIRSMDGLTNAARAVLWQLQNKSWKAKANPFDKTVGERVYKSLHAEDGDQEGLSLPSLSGTGSTGKEAPGELQGLSLPSLD